MCFMVGFVLSLLFRTRGGNRSPLATRFDEMRKCGSSTSRKLHSPRSWRGAGKPLPSRRSCRRRYRSSEPSSISEMPLPACTIGQTFSVGSVRTSRKTVRSLSRIGLRAASGSTSLWTSRSSGRRDRRPRPASRSQAAPPCSCGSSGRRSRSPATAAPCPGSGCSASITLTGVLYCRQVESSWMHIWIDPSPVMQNTSDSGLASLMPIAYGMTHTHGAQPPGIDPAPRLVEPVVLRGPHLVLTDIGRDVGIAMPRVMLPQLLHDHTVA